MKFCRFHLPVPYAREAVGEASPSDSLPRHGVLRGETVHEIVGDVFGVWNETGRTWPLSHVRLAPPVIPSKVVCVGRNYSEHATELGNAVPKEPLIFLKPATSVIGPEEAIQLPRISQQVDFEGELAVVIGRRCLHPAPGEDLRGFIAGYTCLNDVTARDLQRKDVAQFTRAKCFDTFCPVGPVMETELDMAAASIETRVNGRLRQHGRPAEMLFSVDVIIHWVTQVMTLLPGDIIALGTPPGVGALCAGDMVEVEVSGIGVLRNVVVPAPGTPA
jgi:2-keto-4-pentenoate hydratase/2-oxohepta-3-ene-1,7-dioic acid hydratase in catechol pathway